MMAGVVVDTHTIVWYLSQDFRLSRVAHDALTSATARGELIHIPSICLVELTYLGEKGRLPSAAREAPRRGAGRSRHSMHSGSA
jgi:PIN domain nuclease of toxin-antitoxin system